MLHLIYQQIKTKTHLWPQDWKRPVFISIEKKGNAKECLNYCELVLASVRLYSNPSSHASTVHELGTFRCTSCVLKRQKNQRLNSQHHQIIEKAREFQKNIYYCFTDYAKAFDSVDHKNCGKLLKR